MENLQIQAHQFDSAKDKLKSISSSVENVSLSSFATKSRILPWCDHNVTGQEMNDFVNKLQKTFKEINNNTKQTYDFIKEVYIAFESLDKEYIQGILAAINSAKIASDQANVASKAALDACSKANIAQIDIKKTIEALQITVKTLIEFKKYVLAKLASTENISNHAIENLMSDLPEICISHIEPSSGISRKLLDHHQYNIIFYIIAVASLILTIGQLVLRMVGIL